MRKIITAFLIVSLSLNLTGCYSMQEISKEELIQQVDKNKIRIWTKKSKFTFEESNYLIQNDSIIGHGKSEMLGGKSFSKQSVIDFNDKIALSDVRKIESDKFNLTITLIAVGVPLALIIYTALTFKVLGDNPLGSGRL